MALDPDSPNTGRTSFWRKLFTFQVISNLILAPTILFGILTLGFGLVPSPKLGFICQDPSISFPFRGDTISNKELWIICFTFPLFLIVSIELIRNGYKKIRFSTIWFFYKEVLVTSWFVTFITETTKLMFVEHRPHFLDTCQPDKNFNCTPGTYIEDYTCTNQEFGQFFISIASRSFPSGHAATSTCCGIFCVYIIQTRLPSAVTGSILKLLMKGLFIACSIYCCLTRLSDRRHHWWDVLCGAIVGSLCTAYFLVLFHKITRKHKLHEHAVDPLVSDATSRDHTKLIQV